jgi:hypothetical protein
VPKGWRRLKALILNDLIINSRVFLLQNAQQAIAFCVERDACEKKFEQISRSPV